MRFQFTLAQLEYTVALADHGHFGRAAASCGVSQPALSMQLRSLERTLGLAIFDRSRSPVVTTDLGAIVVEQARALLRDGAALAELPARMAGRIEGELRLGVLPTLAPYLLPRALPALARRYPALRLTIMELPTPLVLERLRAESIDAGLIATPPDDPGMHHRALFREPLMLYVHAGHPLAPRKRVRPDELSSSEAWLLSDEHCLRQQSLALCGEHDAEGAGLVRFESGNVETLRRLVESGDGFTLVPWLALPNPVPRSVRVIPLGPPSAYREIQLVHRRQYLKRHLIDAVVGALLEALPVECPLVTRRT